jgi:hypothetical protein
MTFYHGTPNCLDDGHFLIPGCDCGQGEGMTEVYITQHIGLARQYATDDGYIYMVEPSEDIQPDFLDEDGVPFTFTCSTAKVLCCVW